MLGLIFGIYLTRQEAIRIPQKNLATPTNIPVVTSTQNFLEPAKTIKGWKTFYGSHFSLQYPPDWVLKNYLDGQIYLTNAEFKETGNYVCSPSESRATLESRITPTERGLGLYKVVTESEFYNVNSEFWNVGTGGGGTSDITMKILPLGNKKAVLRNVLWTSGYECWTKPRMDYMSLLYLGGNDETEQLILRGYYYPDEGFKQIIDTILSTINFNFDVKAVSPSSLLIQNQCTKYSTYGYPRALYKCGNYYSLYPSRTGTDDPVVLLDSNGDPVAECNRKKTFFQIQNPLCDIKCDENTNLCDGIGIDCPRTGDYKGDLCTLENHFRMDCLTDTHCSSKYFCNYIKDYYLRSLCR
ncbi:MAG: hypothetical protein UT04_C0062G0007 [Candidatus Daviesbacteria bacterium GW2011_GWF2_38_7]|nr:MAG: hypothetical protein UT04_C0062G0007 [Candidatus Daviesbacteria bacterium GW2011_GWF2_38_7]